MIAIVAFAGLVACQVPLPNEVLPAATGPQNTGRMSFHWKDTSRAELETSAPDDKRELMVRHPVIIFSPGGGMKGLTYHTLFEDLASHGWVVAAIDPRTTRAPCG